MHTAGRSRKLRILERFQISRCLGGGQLPCGCNVGVYETYDGQLVPVVDAAADSCGDRSHQVDYVIDLAALPADLPMVGGASIRRAGA
ncbi:MAG TPA: hypothetical protein VIL35_15770 [Vicinamibacterales bacterium]